MFYNLYEVLRLSIVSSVCKVPRAVCIPNYPRTMNHCGSDEGSSKFIAKKVLSVCENAVEYRKKTEKRRRISEVLGWWYHIPDCRV